MAINPPNRVANDDYFERRLGLLHRVHTMVSKRVDCESFKDAIEDMSCVSMIYVVRSNLVVVVAYSELEGRCHTYSCFASLSVTLLEFLALILDHFGGIHFDIDTELIELEILFAHRHSARTQITCRVDMVGEQFLLFDLSGPGSQ